MILNQSIKLEDVSKSLGISNIPDTWEESWKQSMGTFCGNDLYFLKHDYFIWANKFLLLEEDALEAIQRAATIILENSNMSALVWHCRRLILEEQKTLEPISFRFPVLENEDVTIKDLIFAVALISCLEGAVLLHKKRGLDEQITRDTFGDLALWMKHFYRINGRWGLGENNWLLLHFTGRLLKLGRLQFAINTFNENIKVYKNEKSKEVVAFYEEGVKFNKDGQIDGTNGIFEPDGGWYSSYKITGNDILVKPISPIGNGMNHIHKIVKEEWELVLSKGDNIMEVHIPAEGSLHPDPCARSFEMAVERLGEYFPERKIRAFTCDSWLLDSKLQEILPPGSNIVKFQQEFYLYPVLGSDEQTFERVFGEKPRDLEAAPRNTMLQKAILDYYSKGGRLSNMGGFILKEDLRWGSAVYQKGWKESMMY